MTWECYTVHDAFITPFCTVYSPGTSPSNIRSLLCHKQFIYVFINSKIILLRCFLMSHTTYVPPLDKTKTLPPVPRGLLAINLTLHFWLMVHRCKSIRTPLVRFLTLPYTFPVVQSFVEYIHHWLSVPFTLSDLYSCLSTYPLLYLKITICLILPLS